MISGTDLDPAAVKDMTLGQKRDCMSEINSRREFAWKFSVIFFFGALIYIFVYMMFSFLYTLRNGRLLQSLSPLFFVMPLLVLIPSFFAHSMSRFFTSLTALAYIFSGMGLIAALSLANAWAAPFAFAGAFVYIRLLSVCGTYSALSKEKGFPDFEDLEALKESAKIMLNKMDKDKKEEAPLNALTEAAIMISKRAAEKSAAEAEEKTEAESSPAETEAKPESESSPAETEAKPEAENSPAEAEEKTEAESSPAEIEAKSGAEKSAGTPPSGKAAHGGGKGSGKKRRKKKKR